MQLSNIKTRRDIIELRQQMTHSLAADRVQLERDYSKIKQRVYRIHNATSLVQRLWQPASKGLGILTSVISVVQLLTGRKRAKK